MGPTFVRASLQSKSGNVSLSARAIPVVKIVEDLSVRPCDELRQGFGNLPQRLRVVRPTVVFLVQEHPIDQRIRVHFHFAVVISQADVLEHLQRIGVQDFSPVALHGVVVQGPIPLVEVGLIVEQIGCERRFHALSAGPPDSRPAQTHVGEPQDIGVIQCPHIAGTVDDASRPHQGVLVFLVVQRLDEQREDRFRLVQVQFQAASGFQAVLAGRLRRWRIARMTRVRVVRIMSNEILFLLRRKATRERLGKQPPYLIRLTVVPDSPRKGAGRNRDEDQGEQNRMFGGTASCGVHEVSFRVGRSHERQGVSILARLSVAKAQEDRRLACRTLVASRTGERRGPGSPDG